MPITVSVSDSTLPPRCVVVSSHARRSDRVRDPVNGSHIASTIFPSGHESFWRQYEIVD